MGGGHVTRPDFGLPQADSANPMTEFYALLMQALNRNPVFTLPGAYVAFHPPYGENLYADTIRDYCTFSGEEKEGFLPIFVPAKLHLLNEELAVSPAGAPAALMLTEDATRRVTAVQLLPPVFCAGEALPPVPDSTAALALQLTDADILAADADPAAAGRLLAERAARKQWLHHPAIERWLATALSAAQRSYHRSAPRPPF